MPWRQQLKRWLPWLSAESQRSVERIRPALRRHRGIAAERLAASYLRHHGFAIEATNVRCRRGEIDLVARAGSVLCFVEVRSKTSLAFGSAAESVTTRKQQRIIRAAQWYLQRRRPLWQGPIRFDVVAIDSHLSGTPTLTLIKNAFAADGLASW